MKRTFVFLVALMIIPGLVMAAADKGGKKVLTGKTLKTVQGITVSMADAVKTASERRFEPKKTKPVMNFKSPRRLKGAPSQDKTTGKPTTGGGTENVTGVSGFAGMNLSSNGSGWPPDTNGDVGRTNVNGKGYYIQTVNASIAIYDKATGAAMNAPFPTFDQFFQGSAVSGTPCDEDNWGDPIVLYDWDADRWFMLDFAWGSGHPDGFWFSVAVTKTNDPLGDWWLYAFQADPDWMNDYPKVGIWGDGIYVTANMFNYDSGSFLGSQVWVFEKPAIYNGTLNSLTVFDNSWEAWSLMPANHRGYTAAPAGSPNYVFAIDCDEWGAPGQDALFYWKCSVNWTTNQLTWDGSYVLPVAAFGLDGGRITQPRGCQALDSLYGRLMYSNTYRNDGGVETMYMCHNALNGNAQSMRWYKLTLNGGSFSVTNQATLNFDNKSRFMGSMSANGLGEIAMGYSLGDRKKNASIYVLDVLAGTETEVKAATGCQMSYNRWGDYSMMSVDPDDDETFWYTTEYYSSTGTNWQTWIVKFNI